MRQDAEHSAGQRAPGVRAVTGLRPLRMGGALGLQLWEAGPTEGGITGTGSSQGSQARQAGVRRGPQAWGASAGPSGPPWAEPAGWLRDRQRRRRCWQRSGSSSGGRRV